MPRTPPHRSAPATGAIGPLLSWIAPGWGDALTLVLLWLAYCTATWGHVELWWGDSGRWLHEVARHAAGEVPYRDFTWVFPPLSIWVLGGVARLFGSGLAPIWTATSLLTLLIFALYYAYAALLVPHRARWPVVFAGLLLALAYAQERSAPLSMGLYVPAAPLGFACILAATLLATRALTVAPETRAGRTGALRCAALGVATGLAVLSKQDFWAPALVLCWAPFVQAAWRERAALAATAAAPVVAVGVIGAGAARIFAQSGLDPLLQIPGSFGVAGATALREIVPTWERITLQTAALGWALGVGAATLIAAGALVGARARRRTLAALLVAALTTLVYLGVTWSFHGAGPLVDPQTATPVERAMSGIDTPATAAWRALRITGERLLKNALPAALPVLALGWVVLRRRRIPAPLLDLLVALLVVACTARLRRLGSQTEWFNVLLELPAYALLAQLYFVRERVVAAITLVCLALGTVAGVAYYRFGVGLLTRAGPLERVETPMGAIRLSAHDAAVYRAFRDTLDRLDPGRRRPLLAFGYTGGFNYFLDRANPTPITMGFHLGGRDPERIVERLRRMSPPPILIDTDLYASFGTPPVRFDLRTWEPAYVPNDFHRFDRAHFDALARGARRVARIEASRIGAFAFFVLDRPGSASGPSSE